MLAIVVFCVLASVRASRAPPPTAAGPRMVGYVENWGWGQRAPSAASLAPLTDVILAFAVSYSGDPATSSCAQEKCTLSADPLSYQNTDVDTLAKTAHYLKTTGGDRRAMLSIGGVSGATSAAQAARRQPRCSMLRIIGTVWPGQFE